MRDHHALRRAGRPGRIQDVGKVGLDGPVPGKCLVRFRQHRIPGQDGGPARGGQGSGFPRVAAAAPVRAGHYHAAELRNDARHRDRLVHRSLVGQDHGDAAVPDDGGQPPGGRLRVERDVACPGLQRPEHRHDRGGRLGGEDPHPIARRHALREERAGYLVAQLVQLFVGEEPTRRGDRR